MTLFNETVPHPILEFGLFSWQSCTYKWQLSVDDFWGNPIIETEAFFTPGHAYLAVHVSALDYFGVAEKVSGYSYLIDGSYVLLEEDCDWPLFEQAVKNHPDGWKLEWTENDVPFSFTDFLDSYKEAA